MSDSAANSDKIITQWIIEYARSLMWKQFKCNSTSSDEFIRGVVTEAECSGCCSGESLLTEWLYLIRCGCTLPGSGLDITPLEKAFSMLPRLKDNFRSLKKKDLIKVEHLLKEQAVLVCVKGCEFGLARKVKDRLWNDTTQNEQEMSSRLDLIIQSRSLSGFDASSSFEDLMESVRNLLEELCENQLPHPYLITRATEEGNKKVCNEEDQMARNLAAATHTGIVLTGPLLSTFISKFKLQPDIGVGFVSQDKFESAVECLRRHKDRILMSDPCISSTPVTVDADSLSPEPVVKEKRVSSSSLKRKSREQRLSNGGRIHEQTSISPKGIRQKDSSSSDDSSDDHDRLSAKTHNISLRTRLARSRGEPLFEDVERRLLRSPTKPSNQLEVRRKPRSKWTAEEERKVYKAVKKYGVSSWADIVKANVLPGRSNVDIKDKWRTMLKTGRVEELKDELRSRLDSCSEED